MLKILKIIWFILLIWFFYYINNFSEEEVVLEKKWENKNIQQGGFSPLWNFCNQFIEKWYYYKVWSDTIPQINETHIFCGEYNSKWKPTWFHSMSEWIVPKTVEIIKLERKDKYWIYNAKIKIYDIRNDKFNYKFSSIFPDNLSPDKVEKAILNAWNHKYFYKNSQFKWKSGLGFEIWWYTYKWNKKINTAYPIYKK
jgi:hypothetical protein